jgi:hypothetical protein
MFPFGCPKDKKNVLQSRFSVINLVKGGLDIQFEGAMCADAS